MAPRAAGKRAAQEAKVPAAKRPRANSMLKAVEEGIAQAGFLPEHCKKMLLATLPFSLDVPADERGEAANAAVRMLGDMMESLTTHFEESARAAQAQLDSLAAARGELEAAVSGADAALADASAAVKAREAALAQASEAAVAARAALAERRQAQQSSSATLTHATEAQAVLAAAIDVHLKGIAQGEEGALHFQAVQPVLGDMAVDDSLLVALPSICAKPASERVRFDNLAIEELGTAMQAKAGELAQQVEQRSSELEERATETDAAQAELTAAEGARSAAKEAVAAAQGGHRAAEAVLEGARAAVDGHEPACQSAREAQEARALELQNHEAYTLSVFKLLRDRTSVKQDPDAVCKEAAAEPEEDRTQESAAAAEPAEARELDGAKEPEVSAQEEPKVPGASPREVTELCISAGGA